MNDMHNTISLNHICHACDSRYELQILIYTATYNAQQSESNNKLKSHSSAAATLSLELAADREAQSRCGSSHWNKGCLGQQTGLARLTAQPSLHFCEHSKAANSALVLSLLFTIPI